MPFWRRVGVAATTLMMSTVGVAFAGATVGSADAAQQRGSASFRVASFNILGSQHTARSKQWASGTKRARLAKRWLNGTGVTVAGVQEAQVGQMRKLTARNPLRAYPHPKRSVNTQTAQSVVWNNRIWRKVEARTFRIPFHYNQVREQPMVRLRHRSTGRQVWVISTHMTTGNGARAAKERKVGTRRLVKNVNKLRATGVPVIVTGDMNSRAPFFCSLTGGTNLVTPAGGSNAGRCKPPRYSRIDWLFGSPAIRWSGFRYADGGLLNRITDHTVPVARATL